LFSSSLYPHLLSIGPVVGEAKAITSNKELDLAAIRGQSTMKDEKRELKIAWQFCARAASIGQPPMSASFHQLDLKAPSSFFNTRSAQHAAC
jgi:hypothetical protein